MTALEITFNTMRAMVLVGFQLHHRRRIPHTPRANLLITASSSRSLTEQPGKQKIKAQNKGEMKHAFILILAYW